MSPAEIEIIRLSLLRYCEAAGRSGYSMSTVLLLASLKAEGFSHLTRPEVESELLYLRDKGLLDKLVRPVSPELSHWRITAAGRDFLASNSFSA